MSEAALQHAIRLAVGALPGVALWRNETGQAQHGRAVVRYGLCRGSADLIGLVSPSGRFLALEVKSPRGRVSAEQKLFLDLVTRMGGVGRVVRSVDEALAAVEEAR